MEALSSALQALGPVAYSDVPPDPRERRAYIRDSLEKARLIVESIPEPPNRSHNANGSAASASSSSSEQSPGSTDGAGLTSLSSSPSLPSLESLAELQKVWGKPVNKFENNEKDNPLRIPVYKLGLKDGKGAWFARRSIHDGLSFETWKSKLQREFVETLEMRNNNSKALENGYIRGIGCDRILESESVRDDSYDRPGNEGSTNENDIGRIEVYHLSAQFPGPSSPRDFVTLLISSDKALELPSESANGKDKTVPSPRSYIIVSRPCYHHDSEPQDGFVRGRYESVEFIREIPNVESQVDSTISNTGSTGNSSSVPIEWIMISRSDPGGSVPRWMVEKGTPPSIVSDAVKFVKWASKQEGDDVEDTDGSDESNRVIKPEDTGGDERKPSNTKENPQHIRRKPVHKGGGNAESGSNATDVENSRTSQGPGVISSAANMVTAGLEMYAPKVVTDSLLNSQRNQESNDQLVPDDEGSDSASMSSDLTFTSAESQFRNSDGGVVNSSRETNNNKGADAALGTEAGTSRKEKNEEQISSHKGLAKLALRKKELEEKLAACREESASLNNVGNRESVSDRSSNRSMEERGDNSQDNNQTDEKENKDKDKDRNKKKDKKTADREKQSSKLSQQESKLLVQIKKIEDQQSKVASKIEHKQRKDAGKDEVSKVKKKNEGLKKEVVGLKSQVSELRQERQDLVKLVSKLQQENAQLVTNSEKTEETD